MLQLVLKIKHMDIRDPSFSFYKHIFKKRVMSFFFNSINLNINEYASQKSMLDKSQLE